MIKEDYVSFEVAKLLKEKGFNPLECGMYYSITTGKRTTELLTSLVACPTLQMAMKWLREVHGLHIHVFVGMNKSYDADNVMVDKWHFWTYQIITINGEIVYNDYDQFDVVEHQTYEEAEESAILFCLNNLI